MAKKTHSRFLNLSALLWCCYRNTPLLWQFFSGPVNQSKWSNFAEVVVILYILVERGREVSAAELASNGDGMFNCTAGARPKLKNKHHCHALNSNSLKWTCWIAGGSPKLCFLWHEMTKSIAICPRCEASLSQIIKIVLMRICTPEWRATRWELNIFQDFINVSSSRATVVNKPAKVDLTWTSLWENLFSRWLKLDNLPSSWPLLKALVSFMPGAHYPVTPKNTMESP